MTNKETRMITNLTATNVELTDEIRSLLEDKLEDSMRPLGRANRSPVKLDIELEQLTATHLKEREADDRFRAEATVDVPGHTFRVEGHGSDLPAAIVQMKHRLTREIRDWKERSEDVRNRRRRAAKEMVRQEPLPTDPDATDER